MKGGNAVVRRGKKRLTVEFPETLSAILDDLASHEGSTKTEILKRAILLYEVLVKEKNKGNRLTIADEEDRILKEIVA